MVKPMRYLFAVVAILLAQACIVFAGKVILNIKVVNPSDQPQTKVISQALPGGLNSNDIISLDGMELCYDSSRTGYVVRTEIELGPKQSKTFEVEVRDVWVIRDDELADLSRHAKKLGTLLEGSIHAARGVMLETAITNCLDVIAGNQAANEAARAGAERHIDAFERNNRQLNSVKGFIAELEDIVVSIGKDPDRLTLFRGSEGAVEGPVSESDRVVFKVIAMNMSATESRSLNIKQYLPSEVGAGDVIDADSLQVRPDLEKGACFVFKDGVELKPAETLSFNVVVKDRWNVNGKRMKLMKYRLVAAWEKARALKDYKSIEVQISRVVELMKTIEQAVAPATLDQGYIGFYKAQTSDLGVVDGYIARIERMVPGAPAPPARYAWLAIYGLIVFVAIFGAAVFLRVARK